ncbi:MAG: hypothetical protein HFJ10_06940 [Lachnospiraceae bacterium]|nr:hypothetical protein [Lachnospiraceae bacterium]
MEQLLRGQEIPAVVSKLVENCYDLTRPILYFPVRHHSPACAFHLKRAIADYEPDCILIEGPENAENLIPVLTHPDTKPPLALYYAYRDKKGLVSPEKEDYKCYYPFLDCSPELVALREAAKRGIEARFIDLPYGEILIGTKENQGIRRKGEKQTYNDDYLLSRSRYLALLCEKTGLRDFEELWEKYFEIQGLHQETKVFVRQMLTYCALSRQNTPREEMEEDGCLLREQYMAEQIAKTSQDFRRILVVTGGFHTCGFGDLIEEDFGKKVRFQGKSVKLHNTREDGEEVYPMSYSMEAADALNGYASGMQSPGFYHQVWKSLESEGSSEGVYKDAVLHFLAMSGRRARRKEESISSYDEICAFSMAEGLAALRGKQEPGLYELRDSALSCFVKGEYSVSTDGAMRALKELVTGSQVGSLCADAMRPPMLSDFEEQCKYFGLKIHSAMEQEVTLEIFAKEKHLKMSRFFYQTEFLDCGFAKRKKGSDLVNRRDRNRIREIWTYKWSSQVMAALIDASISGGTIAEAVHSLLHSRFDKSTGCREAAELLVRGFLMGLSDEQEKMREHLSQVLAGDGDFFSLTQGLSQLLTLSELQDLYKVRDRMDLERMIKVCFQKIIQLLPSMGQIKEEQQQECMEDFRTLYQITGKKAYTDYRPVLAEALERLLERRPIQPAVEGVTLGLLYGYDSNYGEKIAGTAQGYVRGTEEMLAQSATFLRGLFFSARDFVFVSQNFLTLIDELLGRLPSEEFLKLLPELRMAFGYFTPIEVDRIAGRAAALHGKKGKDLLRGRMVDPKEYAYGEELDAYVIRQMKGEEM